MGRSLILQLFIKIENCELKSVQLGALKATRRFAWNLNRYLDRASQVASAWSFKDFFFARRYDEMRSYVKLEAYPQTRFSAPKNRPYVLRSRTGQGSLCDCNSATKLCGAYAVGICLKGWIQVARFKIRKLIRLARWVLWTWYQKLHTKVRRKDPPDL